MAKKRGLLLAGLAAGAYAYFRTPENREKATVAFNNAKAKVNSYLESQNLDKEKSTPVADDPDFDTPEENQMVDEGAMTTVQYKNEEQQDELEEQKNVKLAANDTSAEKSENTDVVSPENKIGTENL